MSCNNPFIMMLIIVVRFILASAECYRYDCSSLDYLECAAFYDSTIWLNEKGCGYLDCNKEYLQREYDAFESTSPQQEESKHVDCFEKEPEPPQEVVTNYYVDCPQEVPGSDLKDGVHPKQCNTEQDCELVSGDFSSCLCGMDGKKYCKPELSSSVFKYYLLECQENSQQILLKDLKMWEYSYDNFIDLVTAPYCAEDTFSYMVLDLDYIVDGACSVGVWVVLLVLE